jgi:hypothetical protein
MKPTKTKQKPQPLNNDFVIAEMVKKITVIKPINTGAKYDHGKARHDLITPEIETEMAEILTQGVDEYGEESWKTIENPIKRYTAALKRHTNAMARGELIDPKSGKYHASHIAVNAMFLQYFQNK